MLRNTVVESVRYFYPLGNTPPVCLTQDLPLEQDAAILILGCGDARNVLFTTYVDPGRKLDFTCCDLEACILARNILLLTSLADAVFDVGKEEKLKHAWNIYYHLRLPKASLDLLESHVDKLLRASETLEKWHSGSYGSFSRFCNRRTLIKVREVWSSYSSRQLSAKEKLARQTRLESAIDRAKQLEATMLGSSPGDVHFNLTAVRSAAPASQKALKDLSMFQVGGNWWNTGVVDAGASTPPQPNPTFLSSPNQALTLHYGLDPILGFPLATAFVPMTTKSGFQASKDVVKSARAHFRKWSEAFQQATAEKRVMLRFCVADALALGHALKAAGAGNLTNPCVFSDNWTYEPLLLDSAEYAQGHGGAPTSFDVIDSSNLLDHLGAINVLVATAPLLAPRPASTLYTEMLVKLQKSSQADRMSNLLCGDVQTMALLLGLAPVETWTNATSCPEVDQAMLESAGRILGGKQGHTETSSRTRIAWKNIKARLLQPVAPNANVACPQQIQVSPQDLARLLHSIYTAMFPNESPFDLMKNLNQHGISKLSNPYYNRASFAALLKYLQPHISGDRQQTVKLFWTEFEKDLSMASIRGNYAQELYQYLHLYGVHTVEKLEERISNVAASEALGSYFSGLDVPSVCCITVEVPRKYLKPFTEPSPSPVGTPALRCGLRDLTALWDNHFSSIQIGFGRLRQPAASSDSPPDLEVVEDPAGWDGSSPLLASFLVPTWILLRNPSKTLVACGLQSTPQAVMHFVNKIGVNLVFYETELQNKRNVHISRFMPNMTTHPGLTTMAATTRTSTMNDGAKATISATIPENQAVITRLACRVNLKSDRAKSILADKTCFPEIVFPTPTKCEIAIGGALKYTILLPAAVNGSAKKVLIARTSSYVEAIVPLWQPVEAVDSAAFIFPSSLGYNPRDPKIIVPVNWNLPRVHLDRMPEIDTKDKEQIDWLRTHASVAFSMRERRRREAGMAGRLPAGTPPDIRLEVKEGILTLFLVYSGLDGDGKSKIFGFGKDGSGIQMLFLPSALRLDINSRTVLLDTAVIPLTPAVRHDAKMQQFLGALARTPMCQTRITEPELRVWKGILPAFAERCRTWSHRNACEYVETGEVPPARGLDAQQTPLCSCGLGQFPSDYIRHKQLPNLDHALKTYATRIAISSIFVLPYVEELFEPAAVPAPLGDLSGKVAGMSLDQGCALCGRRQRKDGQPGALLVCGSCKSKKYCSADCQKKDWKLHKVHCRSSS